jgi:hypothetical protein
MANDRSVALGGKLVLFGGAAAAAAPWALNIDGMGGGYALMVLGGFAALVGAIVTYTYDRRAATAEAMLADPNLLVRWAFTADEWNPWATAQHADDAGAANCMVGLVAVFALLGGGLIYADDPRDNGPLAAGISLGLIAFVFVISRLAVPGPRDYLLQPGEKAQVMLGREGVQVHRELHTWNVLGARLEYVSFESADRPHLTVTYSLPSRRSSRNKVAVELPVPKGAEEEARRVAAQLCPPGAVKPPTDEDDDPDDVDTDAADDGDDGDADDRDTPASPAKVERGADGRLVRRG